MIEITQKLRAIIEQNADADWVSPQWWLEKAILQRARADAAEREQRRSEMRPAAWEGWVFHPSDPRWYYGPRDALLHFEENRWLNRSEGDRRDTPDKTRMRPWDIGIRHVPLAGRNGLVRTFKTPEAAIAALYASPEFNHRPDAAGR